MPELVANGRFDVLHTYDLGIALQRTQATVLHYIHDGCLIKRIFLGDLIKVHVSFQSRFLGKCLFPQREPRLRIRRREGDNGLKTADSCLINSCLEIAGEDGQPAISLQVLQQVGYLLVSVLVVRILDASAPAKQGIGFVEE